MDEFFAGFNPVLWRTKLDSFMDEFVWVHLKELVSFGTPILELEIFNFGFNGIINFDWSNWFRLIDYRIISSATASLPIFGNLSQIILAPREDSKIKTKMNWLFLCLPWGPECLFAFYGNRSSYERRRVNPCHRESSELILIIPGGVSLSPVSATEEWLIPTVLPLSRSNGLSQSNMGRRLRQFLHQLASFSTLVR